MHPAVPMDPARCPDAVDPADWMNWRWQMQNRIHSAEAMAEWIDLTPDERKAIDETDEVFRWNVTPYYASLMAPADPSCPVRRQVVPTMDELGPDLAHGLDPLDETGHEPVKNLIHNYEDRVAFCVTAECAVYCRFCLRKRMVGDAEYFMRTDEHQAAIDYIAAHDEIRDVLLTGGDPLTFNEDNLAWLLGQLRAIDHVELIRFGTRMPVKLPYRITEDLCNLLAEHHPLWINTHFNHPKELTEDAAAAIDRLKTAGVPVGNQTVLLRGINDDVATMKALNEGLVRMRVRPYYLYQAQLIGGTAHLRTPIETGMHIMRQLRGRTSGFAIPDYVLDTPHGKVPLNRSYVRGRAGDRVVMETYDGTLWAEPNPIREGMSVPFRLPSVPLPDEAATLPMKESAPPTAAPALNGTGTRAPQG